MTATTHHRQAMARVDQGDYYVEVAIKYRESGDEVSAELYEGNARACFLMAIDDEEDAIRACAGSEGNPSRSALYVSASHIAMKAGEYRRGYDLAQAGLAEETRPGMKAELESARDRAVSLMKTSEGGSGK